MLCLDFQLKTVLNEMFLINSSKASKRLIRLRQVINNLDFHYASNASLNIFDSKSKRLQKDVSLNLDESHKYDYLKEEIAYRVVDRVYDIKRRFPVVLDFGCYKGFIGKYLTNV